MPLSERIVVDPEILAGKPVVRGTRLAVEFILELLAAGQSENELLANYPGLKREDILASLILRALRSLAQRPQLSKQQRREIAEVPAPHHPPVSALGFLVTDLHSLGLKRANQGLIAFG